MATQVQFRGGTTAQNNAFTGASKELTVDTDKDVVVVHDGATAGGHPLMAEDGSNSALASGTAGTPALKFDGTSTGIYSPGADQLAISTNGTGRLFIDSLGNVAIGTTSITNLTNYAQLVLNDSNGGFIDIEDDGVPQARIIGSGNELTIRATGTGGLISFDTDGSNERARIDSLGRLLVGMSSQSGGSLLQVNDDRIRIASSKTPASASDTGTAGEICWDSSYIYVCTATDTWKRAALSTW